MSRLRFPRYLDQDDVVIAVGMGFLVGGLAELSLAAALMFFGLLYIGLAVVLGK